ncbi:hypothetical protein LTR93_011544 [Exophiala xenobiotica]|nr:hypothetical protein LTR93_011544 [Exophiala xenobiotica]
MNLDGPSGASLTGTISSLYYIGGVVGGVAHGCFANRFGRKPSILFAFILLLVSQALLDGSVNVAMFIVFSFFVGMGGFQTVIGVGLWVTELVPPRDRGKLTYIVPININFGYTIIGYVGVGFYMWDSAHAWRWPTAIAAFPGLISLAGFWWLPESLRYLMSRQRQDDAWKIIHGLHSDRNDPTDDFAKREFYQIYQQIHFDRSLKTTFTDIFKRPSNRKRVIITVTLNYCVMSAGLLVIQNYGVSLYAALGYTGIESLLLQTGYTLLLLCVMLQRGRYDIHRPAPPKQNDRHRICIPGHLPEYLHSLGRKFSRH